MNQGANHILAVKNLCNRYEGIPLLQNINFSLLPGEILCLLGPSGSGKTTLLRLIAGLDKEDSGSIIFAGRDISTIPPHKRKFGMMFQEYALFPHKNVHDNVAFGLEMLECPAAERLYRVEAMLQLVGLQGLGRRRIDELSGGERQRVALARSLAPEPQLLLLDEPLGSLDRTLRERLTGEIRSILKKLGVTSIFVTHDQAEAFSVADKIAVLHNGILQQFDTPEGLYRQPRNATVAAFLGFTNVIDSHLDADGICHCSLGPLPLPALAEKAGQPITLLIRPEGAKLIDQSTGPVPGNLNIFGTVSNRIFQGGSFRLTLQCGVYTLTFDLPIDPPPPEVGMPLHLAVHPSALVLIN